MTRADDALVALRAQGETLAGWFTSLDDADYVSPSVLPGWDVRMLLAHLVLIFEGTTSVLAMLSDEPADPAADYVRRYRRDVQQIAERTERTAADRAPADLLDALRAAVEAVPSEAAQNVVLAGPRGPISTLDWITTRVIDVAVHSDDLTRSLEGRDPVPISRAVLAIATRALAEILAAQAPGRSVEVRVPPFVAIQAVAGPRHTRGTPPNVVETDPVTWLRIATGRVPFADAVQAGAVRASGNRADLTPYLPLLS